MRAFQVVDGHASETEDRCGSVGVAARNARARAQAAKKGPQRAWDLGKGLTAFTRAHTESVNKKGPHESRYLNMYYVKKRTRSFSVKVQGGDRGGRTTSVSTSVCEKAVNSQT